MSYNMRVSPIFLSFGSTGDDFVISDAVEFVAANTEVDEAASLLRLLRSTRRIPREHRGRAATAGVRVLAASREVYFE